MPLIRSISLPLVARVTVEWGVLFAVVHFYWASGGTARNNAGATDAAAQTYIGFIALVGLLSAAVAHGFGHDWAARLGRRRLTLLARVGGAVLMLGVRGGVGRWLGDGGAPRISRARVLLRHREGCPDSPSVPILAAPTIRPARSRR